MLPLMRRVFIHCGLHKTGTTAIQQIFSAHREILLAHNVLYPRSDQFGGHHNLAWALTRDRRLSQSGVTWRQALDEISCFDGDAVLSSEDFESSLHRPDHLSAIAQAIRGTGRQPCVVVYTRGADAYIESLYLELLKHQYAVSFGAYQREIRQTGFLKYQEWVFQFDIDRVWSALREVPGLQFVQRDYQGSYGQGVAADFLSVLGLPPRAFGQAVLSRFNQRRAAAASIATFLFNRTRRPLSAAECAIIAQLCPRKQVQWSIGNPERPEFPKTAHGPVYYLNRVFSSRTVETIRDLAGPAGAWNLQNRLQQLASWWQGGALATFVAYQYQAVLNRPPSFQFVSETDNLPPRPALRYVH